jgi:hypothetical protein
MVMKKVILVTLALVMAFLIPLSVMADTTPAVPQITSIQINISKAAMIVTKPTVSPQPLTTPSVTPRATLGATAQPSPTAGFVQNASIQVKLNIQNFKVIGNIATPSTQSGDGYIIFYPDMLPAASGFNVEGVKSTDTTFNWDDVEPGFHVISAELVDKDGNPMDPPVVAIVGIMVQSPIQGEAPQASTTPARSPTSSPTP